MKTNLKIVKRVSPNLTFLYRLIILICATIIWFSLLFINNEPALNDAKKALHSGALWYFITITFVFGFAIGLMLIETKSKNRMQTELIFAFVFTILAGATEKYILHTSGIFTASFALISYIFSRIIYTLYEEKDRLKKRKNDEKTLANGPFLPKDRIRWSR